MRFFCAKLFATVLLVTKSLDDVPYLFHCQIANVVQHAVCLQVALATMESTGLFFVN